MAVAAALTAFAVWVLVARFRAVRHHREVGAEVPRLTPWGALGYYASIARSVLLIAWWWLRARGRDGLRPGRGEPSGPPVLLVHGLLLDGTCFWGMRRSLERTGRVTRAVSMGHPPRVLRAYGPKLEAAIRELAEASPTGKIDLVAHSMGGLVLRALLADRPRLAGSLRRIVTLGSPHGGAVIPERAGVLPELQQMRLGARLVGRLPALTELAPQARTTTVGAPLDLTVYPVATTRQPGARHVELPRVGHLGLLTDRAGHGAVWDALER